MDKFLDSISEYYKGRVTSIFIGSLMAFWAAWHWQVFITLFFVSEDAIYKQHHLLKNEYINHYFLGVEQGLIPYSLGYIVPLILTLIYIWVLPKWVFLLSYKAEIQHKTDRKIERAKEERRLDKQLNTLQMDEIKEEVSVANEVKVLEKISPARAKAQSYETDFKRFIRNETNVDSLGVIHSTIYKHYGNIGEYTTPGGDWSRNDVSSDLIARADLNGLVNLEGGGKVSLTEKGKYFLRQYLSN
jgi:hypothetical protein